MITKIEIATGLRHIRQFLIHPSILCSLLFWGRSGAIKKAVKISLSQVSRTPQNEINEWITSKRMNSLIGKIGGWSQEALYYLVRYYRPKIIVETGVYRGISTAFLLQALKDNGNGYLYSIDLPLAKYTAKDGEVDFSPLSKKEETGFAVPNALRDRWKLIIGDSREELPKLLKTIKSVDLFYHDSEHTFEMMTWEFQTIFPFLTNKSVLCSDDILWNNAFQEFCGTHGLSPEFVAEKFGYAEVRNEKTS